MENNKIKRKMKNQKGKNKKYSFGVFILLSVIYFLLFATPLFLPQAAQAATYYFNANNGNDITGDGSSDQPWKSLAKAQSVATDGDIINLRNGNYGVFEDMAGGANRTDWITYQADTGQTDVTISYIDVRNRNLYLRFKDLKVHPGNVSAQYRTAMVYFAGYVDFDNITMTGPGLDVYKNNDTECYGIKIAASNNVTVKNCTISGYKYGVYANYISTSVSSDCSITDCNIYANRFGIFAGGHRINVRRNHVYNGLSDGILVSADYSDVSNNLIHDIERPVTYSATGTFTYTASTRTITATNGEFESMVGASADYLKYVIITVDGTRYSAQTSSWAQVSSIPDANTIILYTAIPSGEWSGYTGGNLTITKVETTPNWHLDGIQFMFTPTAVPRSTVPKYVTANNNKIYNIGYYTWSGGQGIHIGSTDNHNMAYITLENNLVYNICGMALDTLGLVTELTMRNNTFPQISYRGYTGYMVFKPKTTVAVFSGNVMHLCGPYITTSYVDCTLLTDYVRFSSIENNYVSDWGTKWCQTNLNTISSTNTINGMTHDQFKALFKDYDNFDFTLVATSLPTTPATIYGDVSGNGEISAYDAALTAQAAVDLIILTPEQIKAADVSGNGEVSAYDAALIAQRAVGLIEKFPVE